MNVTSDRTCQQNQQEQTHFKRGLKPLSEQRKRRWPFPAVGVHGRFCRSFSGYRIRGWCGIYVRRAFFRSGIVVLVCCGIGVCREIGIGGTASVGVCPGWRWSSLTWRPGARLTCLPGFFQFGLFGFRPGFASIAGPRLRWPHVVNRISQEQRQEDVISKQDEDLIKLYLLRWVRPES